MLNYYQPGETLTTKDLNAIIYLLRKYRKLRETINLTVKYQKNKFANYHVLPDIQNVQHESYIKNITYEDKLYIVPYNKKLDAEYSIILTIKKIDGEKRELRLSESSNGRFEVDLTELDDDDLISRTAVVEIKL